MGSSPREGINVCRCIVPSWHRGTLNSRRAASPLATLVEGEERWEAFDPPECSPSKLNRAKSYCHLVVPARISSQSSRHCWSPPLPHASALIPRDFGCVLGVEQTKQLPHFSKN
ncbi:hypothetical protein TNCV_2413621 [Trichonephila clavipes]|nr:hypothetical protein TNCV_2413621 [Trichonephila clavipes]